jgi:2-isopropylmalate synthase
VLDAVVEAGATTLNIPDTVGYTVPSEFGDLIATIRRRVKGIENVTISAHCHNDLGMAVANTMAAVAAGARQVECTINGIGERAGNASLEEIVMAMRVRHDRYPYDTAVVAEHLFPASQLLSEITGVPVQPNKAVIGRNAFAHEAGIHQDGVLKNPLTYEIMTPQSVGVPDSKLVLGKHSGRHALSIRCEQLGYQFDRRALDDIYRRFVRLADKIKHVEDHHLLELIRDTHKPAGSATPLFEPLPAAVSAAASPEPVRPFPMAPQNNAFPVPLPAPDPHHDQEDYLWGV